MKATDLYFNLVQKQKFLQSVSASERKNPKKLTQSTNFYKSTYMYHKRAFRYCIPYLYDILSSFTSCYKRDFNIIITFNTEYFQLYQLVKHLKELLIEDILRHFPTLCNRSDAEHNLLLFNVSLDRRKF